MFNPRQNELESNEMENLAVIEKLIDSIEIPQLDIAIVDNLTCENSNQPLSENSKKTYESTVRQFNRFIKAHGLLVNEESIKLYFDSIKDLAPASQNVKRSALLKVIKQCVGNDSIIKRLAVEKVFAENVRSYKIDRTVHQDECLTEGQVKRLMEVASTNKTKLMIKFLFVTGMRISEAINIKLRDIALINGLCKIRIVGKGNKERIIYAPADLIEDIEHECVGEKWLFESSSGKQLHRVNVTNAIKSAGRKLDWKVSAHSLRHSRATDMLRKGLCLKSVSSHLGHADVGTTAGLYVHNTVNYRKLFAMDSI